MCAYLSPVCFNTEDRTEVEFHETFMSEHELLAALPLHRNVVCLYGQFRGRCVRVVTASEIACHVQAREFVTQLFFFCATVFRCAALFPR